MMFTNPAEFKAFLLNQNLEQTAVVLMSSGNYGGLDFEEVKGLV
jgi:UDP-N-acetylmuramate: L-alanyl-gamma-D-glutamyl-meso-diaminopimelate ligase